MLRKLILGGFVLVALALGAASAAWACAGSMGSVGVDAYIHVQPVQGVAGSAATVTGGNWQNGTLVEISWSTSSAAGGEVLGSTMPDAQGHLSFPFTVSPSAARGDYYLIGTQRLVAKAAPFRVIVTPDGGGTKGSSGDQSPGAPLVSRRTIGGDSTSPDPATNNNPIVTPDPATNHNPIVTPDPATNSSPTPGVPTAPGTTAQAAPAGQPASGPESGVTGPGLAIPASAPTSAGVPRSATSDATISRSVPEASLGSPIPPSATSAEPRGGVAPEFGGSPSPVDAVTPPTPSQLTALGDLWGGFTDGPLQGAGDLLTLPEPNQALDPALLGVEGLVLGLLSLLAGFAFAEARRRRSLADVLSREGSPPLKGRPES